MNFEIMTAASDGTILKYLCDINLKPINIGLIRKLTPLRLQNPMADKMKLGDQTLQ
jgi:hypothetical protein